MGAFVGTVAEAFVDTVAVTLCWFRVVKLSPETLPDLLGDPNSHVPRSLFFRDFFVIIVTHAFCSYMDGFFLSGRWSMIPFVMEKSHVST